MFVHKEAICTICGLESWLASRCTLGSCESPWPHRCCCCGCCVRCVLLRRITSSQVNSGHVMHVQVAGYDTTNHDTTPEIRCIVLLVVPTSSEGPVQHACEPWYHKLSDNLAITARALHIADREAVEMAHGCSHLRVGWAHGGPWWPEKD